MRQGIEFEVTDSHASLFIQYTMAIRALRAAMFGIQGSGNLYRDWYLNVTDMRGREARVAREIMTCRLCTRARGPL